jgi:hypothetical protein
MNIERVSRQVEELGLPMATEPEQQSKVIPFSQQEVADLLGIPVSRIERIAPLTTTQRDIYLDYAIDQNSASTL